MYQPKTVKANHRYTIFRACGDQQVPVWVAAKVAQSFISRLVGLLPCSAMATDEALIIQPCNSVHTLGMRMAIAVIFVNRDGAVLKILRRLNRGQFARCRGAHAVIETSADNVYLSRLSVGDKLLWSPSC